MYYLPDRAVRELLCQVADLMAPGSTLAMDFLNLDALRKEKPYGAWRTHKSHQGTPTLATRVHCARVSLSCPSRLA